MTAPSKSTQESTTLLARSYRCHDSCHRGSSVSLFSSLLVVVAADHVNNGLSSHLVFLLLVPLPFFASKSISTNQYSYP
jgi:hypothetical protein